MTLYQKFYKLYGYDTVLQIELIIVFIRALKDFL